MTVKEYKSKYPNNSFILTSTIANGGHVHIPHIAMNSLVPAIYEAQIEQVCKQKSGLRNLYIRYNFRSQTKEV